MNKIKVTYYGLIKPVVDKQGEESHLPGEATVRELLDSLAQRYGDRFQNMLLTSDGQLESTVIIQLNGSDINELEDLDTKLGNNSELSITVVPYVIVAG